MTLTAACPEISVGVLGQRVRDINGIGQPALIDPLTAIPPHGTHTVPVSNEYAIRILARLDGHIGLVVECIADGNAGTNLSSTMRITPSLVASSN